MVDFIVIHVPLWALYILWRRRKNIYIYIQMLINLWRIIGNKTKPGNTFGNGIIWKFKMDSSKSKLLSLD